MPIVTTPHQFVTAGFVLGEHVATTGQLSQPIDKEQHRLEAAEREEHGAGSWP